MERDSNITHGAEEVHSLNGEPVSVFAGKYKDTKSDVFFTPDGKAHVTVRMSNLIYHGKDKCKGIDNKRVSMVYCGLEDEFYSLEEYAKLLNGVYKGVRARVKPINRTWI